MLVAICPRPVAVFSIESSGSVRALETRSNRVSTAFSAVRKKITVASSRNNVSATDITSTSSIRISALYLDVYDLPDEKRADHHHHQCVHHHLAAERIFKQDLPVPRAQKIHEHENAKRQQAKYPSC